MVTTTRSRSARSPPKKPPPQKKVYPNLSEEEEEEEQTDEKEDDHEESSTVHPDPANLNTSRSSLNSSWSNFNTSRHAERDFPYGLVFVGLLVVCIAYWLLSSAGVPREATRDEFGQRLVTIVKGHPAFSKEDRDQLRAAANRWFSDSSKDPVVVIIYAPASSTLLDEFTTGTASVLGRKTSVVASTSTTARAHLHATMENTLKGGTKSTIGLREIERLPWDSPLVLHSFADADHIAASRPLIWLQVTRDDSLKGYKCDEAIERTLTSSWLASGGTADNVAPVISRVLQFTICLDWH